MDNETKFFSDCQNEWVLLQKEILKQRSETFVFLHTAHNSEATRRRMESLGKEEEKIAKIMSELFDLQQLPEFQEPAGKLYRQYEKLHNQAERINGGLLRDFDQKQQKEDGKRAVLNQNANLTLITIMVFITAQANHVFGELLNIWGAILSGTLAAAIFIKRNEIKNAFVSTGKELFRRVTGGGISVEAEKNKRPNCPTDNGEKPKEPIP